MTIRSIYAHLDCSSLQTSTAWFEKFFARAPDANPMKGLVEWHQGESAGLQLFENSNDAGRGTLTLIVDALREEQARLEAAGLKPGAVEAADTTSVVRLRDPDGNLVVLAQPGRA